MKTKTQLISYNNWFRILIHLKKQRYLVSVLCIIVFFYAPAALADLPVTGVEVTEMSDFDSLMQTFMATENIQAGILAISKDGRVVYQRGFGHAYNGIDPLPENTPMRLASVSKPHTAAAIRYLIADGDISLDDFAFSVPGQTLAPGQRALLDASTPSSKYYPYGGTFGDSRFGDITIEHLLLYQGGWDSDNYPDPMYSEIAIGEATGFVPPGRIWTVKYTLSQPLHFTPGKDSIYCNFGYMLLSLIVEQETSFQHTDYIRNRVLTPDMWVPETELIFGRTFEAFKNPRETKYIGDPVCPWPNVYDPDGPPIECPYGSFDLEQKTGEGNLVASAAPLLTFLDNYRVNTVDVGMPITGPVDGGKNGRFQGTSTRIQQYNDGFNVVVLFADGSDWHADHLIPQVRSLILSSSGIDWDSLKAIDGFWVDFNASSSGYGGHDDPFSNMNTLLTQTTNGTKVRFKNGSSNWTGTISRRIMLNTPSGTAIIGQ